VPHNLERICQYIDHTLLKPEATAVQVVQLCKEARQYGFASVCVNPCHIPLVARELKATGIRTCSVVGFPLGAHRTEIKAAEAALAVEDGADEIDMVLDIGALKDGRGNQVSEDIKAVIRAVAGRALVKVIIECSLLTAAEKVTACRLAVGEGADFVKTSTGFGHGGATVEDVRLMRSTVGPDIGVKASGGIRDLETLLQMIDAGASRIGSSSGVAIARELENKK
jgi:deoxyribose-phosphate aldolase